MKETAHISAYDKHLVASENELKDSNGAFKINDTSLDIGDMNKIYDAFSSLVKSSLKIGNQINLDLKPVKNETFQTRVKNHTDMEAYGGHSLQNSIDPKIYKLCVSLAGAIISHPFIAGLALALFLIFIILLLICMYCLGKRSAEKSSKHLDLDMCENGFGEKNGKMCESKHFRKFLKTYFLVDKRLFSSSEENSSADDDASAEDNSNTDGNSSADKMNNDSKISREKKSETAPSLKGHNNNWVEGQNTSVSSQDNCNIDQNKREPAIFKWMDNSISVLRPENDKEEIYSWGDTSIDEQQDDRVKNFSSSISKENKNSMVTKINEHQLTKCLDSMPERVDLSIDGIDSSDKSAQQIASNDKLYNQIPPKVGLNKTHYQTSEFTTVSESTYPSNETITERVSKTKLPVVQTYKDTKMTEKPTDLRMQLQKNSEIMDSSDVSTSSVKTNSQEHFGKETSATRLEKKPSVLKKMYKQISGTTPSVLDYSKRNKSIVKERGSSKKLRGSQTSEETKLVKRPTASKETSRFREKTGQKITASKRIQHDVSNSSESKSSDDSSGKSQTSVGCKAESKGNIFQRMYRRVTRLPPKEISRTSIDAETLSTVSISRSENQVIPKKGWSKVFKLRNISKDIRLAKGDKEASSNSELESILSKTVWSSEENVKVEMREKLINRVVKSGNCSKIDDMLTGDEWERLSYRLNRMSPSGTNKTIDEYDNSEDIAKMPSGQSSCTLIFEDDSSTHSLQGEIEESISQAEIQLSTSETFANTRV